MDGFVFNFEILITIFFPTQTRYILKLYESSIDSRGASVIHGGYCLLKRVSQMFLLDTIIFYALGVFICLKYSFKLNMC